MHFICGRGWRGRASALNHQMRATAIITLLVVLAAPQVSAANVEINADGVLLVDGRKVFPIGLTMPPAFDAKGPSGKHAYAELREAGINIIRTGPTAGAAWNDQTLVTELKYQDAAAQHGLRCMVYLHELASIAPGQDKREAMLRRVIAA